MSSPVSGTTSPDSFSLHLSVPTSFFSKRPKGVNTGELRFEKAGFLRKLWCNIFGTRLGGGVLVQKDRDSDVYFVSSSQIRDFARDTDCEDMRTVDKFKFMLYNCVSDGGSENLSHIIKPRKEVRSGEKQITLKYPSYSLLINDLRHHIDSFNTINFTKEQKEKLHIQSKYLESGVANPEYEYRLYRLLTTVLPIVPSKEEEAARMAEAEAERGPSKFPPQPSARPPVRVYIPLSPSQSQDVHFQVNLGGAGESTGAPPPKIPSSEHSSSLPNVPPEPKRTEGGVSEKVEPQTPDVSEFRDVVDLTDNPPGQPPAA